MTTGQNSENSATVDPLAVVHALLAAENAHDVEAAVALFADNASVSLAIEVRTGKEQIRAWQQELANGHFHMEVVGSPVLEGNRVHWSSKLDLEMFQKMGLGTVDAVSEATVENGNIQHYTFSLSGDSAARMKALAAK